MRWDVHAEKVPVRAAPREAAPVLAWLQLGDFVDAAGTRISDGLEWIRLAPAEQVNRSGQSIPLNLDDEGFVLTDDPRQGALMRCSEVQVVVEEMVEKGALSKQERGEILKKAPKPDLLLPLESKYWSKQVFEAFVMTGGEKRPASCSLPDECALAHLSLDEDSTERALTEAASWLRTADAILVGSGAGMGADSGLSTFRGKNAGVWPGLEAVGLAYEEICQAHWFSQEPHLAWAFWNHCSRAYRSTQPHAGYEIVRLWAERAPLGAFSFTSNIDGHWQKASWETGQLVEVHGALGWLQCSKLCRDCVWRAPSKLGLSEDPQTHRARGRLPTCPKCGAVARPAVQMFGGDTSFCKARRSQQLKQYDAWLKNLESRSYKSAIRLVCLELGCGLTVPTVRKELEVVMKRFPGARLIRVNPENPGLALELASRSQSLPLAAGRALQEMNRRANSQLEILWVNIADTRGTVIRVAVPLGSPCTRVCHQLERISKVEYEAKKIPYIIFFSPDHPNRVIPVGQQIPDTHIFSMKASASGCLLKKAVGLIYNFFFDDSLAGQVLDGVHRFHSSEAKRIADILSELLALVQEPAYQEKVAALRRGHQGTQLMELLISAQESVCKNHGLDRLSTKTDVWILQHVSDEIRDVHDQVVRFSGIDPDWDPSSSGPSSFAPDTVLLVAAPQQEDGSRREIFEMKVAARAKGQCLSIGELREALRSRCGIEQLVADGLHFMARCAARQLPPEWVRAWPETASAMPIMYALRPEESAGGRLLWVANSSSCMEKLRLLPTGMTWI